MRGLLVGLLLAVAPAATAAQTPDPGAIVDAHILPGYRTLAARAAELDRAAEADCDPSSATLRQAYGDAFDAWVRVSHLRFGPSEEHDRAFALAFWPDPRGAGPRTLAGFLQEGGAEVADLAAFRDVSVAARGFYALERLLHDPDLRAAAAGDDARVCALIRLVAADIAQVSAALLVAWVDGHSDLMRGAGDNDVYRSRDEALRQLFTALSTGLEFTSAVRLGRPLGTFDRPRPQRAEAWRSERSLRHVRLSLEATRDLARHLSAGDAALDAAFARAIERVDRLDDPRFAGVATPQGRVRVEAVQRAVNEIRAQIAGELGPRLGISAGFNALDGD
ncbi:peptidase M75 [Rhodobacteraceae bacterium CCMM004]|nr:peptidase M75 [Rhodobacteraceae bacterium CCMM004]